MPLRESDPVSAASPSLARPPEGAAIGLVAGSGIYPGTFAQAARSAGAGPLVAAAFRDETDPALADLVDEIAWFRVGQLGKMIRHFLCHGVAHAVMAGQIAPKNLFDLRPDLRTLKILGRLKERNAESLFGAVAEELGKDGIELLPATTFLEDLLPPPGPVCGPSLDEARLQDAAYGYRIAKEVSRLDIGQTVVVKKGTVLAVEAFEGTNEAMRRGGSLGRGGATMVKVSKPRQDFRFDVPVVGPDTVETAADSGIDAIVVEAGRTLLLGKEQVEALCARRKVSLHAIGGGDE